MALLEGLPVIAEDLLEGVFVDPLPCGGHRARLYHVLGTEASRFFTLLSPSLPIASPGGAGRIRDLEKGNSYTLYLSTRRTGALNTTRSRSGPGDRLDRQRIGQGLKTLDEN